MFLLFIFFLFSTTISFYEPQYDPTCNCTYSTVSNFVNFNQDFTVYSFNYNKPLKYKNVYIKIDYDILRFRVYDDLYRGQTINPTYLYYSKFYYSHPTFNSKLYLLNLRDKIYYYVMNDITINFQSFIINEWHNMIIYFDPIYFKFTYGYEKDIICRSLINKQTNMFMNFTNRQRENYKTANNENYFNTIIKNFTFCFNQNDYEMLEGNTDYEYIYNQSEIFEDIEILVEEEYSESSEAYNIKPLSLLFLNN